MARSRSTSMTRTSPEPPVEFTVSAEFPEADDQMKTSEFLNAVTGAVGLSERFGKVFSSVTYDMNANVEKLRVKYEENQQDHKFLRLMILKEQHDGEVTATDALMWLRRYISHTGSGEIGTLRSQKTKKHKRRRKKVYFSTIRGDDFPSIIDDSTNRRASDDLSNSLNKAYMETLEQYHGWLGSQLLNVLSRFAPSRSNFLIILGQTRAGDVTTDVRRYNQKLAACVRWLTEFYSEHGLETFATVIVV